MKLDKSHFMEMKDNDTENEEEQKKMQYIQWSERLCVTDLRWF